jgi:hypothetical protein
MNVEGKPNRVATTVELSPDGKFLVVGTTFDEPAKPNPDGSPIIYVSRNVVEIDTTRSKPSELCWLSISPDDRIVYAANFGYSYVTSFFLEGNVLSVAKDPAFPPVPGNGRFRALNGTVSSGPSDNWLTADGAYLYQLYGNASKLVGYRTHPDGSLEEITRVAIPYNSSQGLAGF